jgi:nicotinate phosphoribosyltransferase
MAVARTTAMVGFAATSNVEAARRFGLRTAGTMAHSYVEAFPTEEEAFRAFAEDFPDRTTFLVDTYDTIDGVREAARVIQDLGLTGRLGVRLDSGDLVALANEARRVLDEAGLHGVRIFASGGLDEFAIERLVLAGAPIDAYGVGTRIGVSADAPYLDTVYKLVAYGDRPVMKTAPAKVTAPGAKQVFRRADFEEETVGLRDEPPPDGTSTLLEQVMTGGRRTGARADLPAARARFEDDLQRLPPAAVDLHNPDPPPVRFSAELERLLERVRGGIVGRSTGRR